MTANQAKKIANLGHWIADTGLMICVLSYMKLAVPGTFVVACGVFMMLPYLVLDFEGVDR